MERVSHTPTAAATRKIARIATLLTRAERNLSAFGTAATNHHDRERIDALARDLRRIVRPLQTMQELLEGGCD